MAFSDRVKFSLGIMIVIIIIATGIFWHTSGTARAFSIEELRTQIDTRNEEIKKLEEEIDALDKSIEKTQGQSKTLKNELSVLNNTIAQLTKQVTVAETKIKKAESSIDKLLQEIDIKEGDITKDKNAVGSMLVTINEYDKLSSVEIILSGEDLSTGWNDLDSLDQLQKAVNERISELETKKEDLIKSKDELTAQRNSLKDLRAELMDKKTITNQSKNTKNRLLAETNSQEATYKKMLDDKKKKKEEMERELFDYEAQLKVAIDPTSFPPAGSRVLGWPVSSPYITQLFGITKDSKRLYASGTHNGVDFRAKQGTAIMASSDGVVMGTGDTDKSCDGVSYGKWVLIKHQNGLATLYAHLSLIKVETGETITAGKIVGYSGNTGYSEGPHLHYSVFVANAVRIAGPREYKSKICGTYLIMPLAPTNAYLDPMTYLPMAGSNIKSD